MNRKDFKIYSNNEYTYLDSAASSLTPDYVINKMNEYYFDYKSNIDRGLYTSASRATYEFETARKKVASFIGADIEDIIFTSGSTDSSNKLVLMLELYLKDKFAYKNEILISDHTHHSELVPLQELAKRNNLNIRLVSKIDTEISDRTLIVSHMLVSNVTGEIFDLKDIFIKAKKYDAFSICDISSGVGHMDINIKDLSPDAAYFSAHKMCGPTGIGALYINRDISRNMKPAVYGGGMVAEVTDLDSKYRSDIKSFEPGTPNIAGVIGFGYACEYLSTLNVLEIDKHLEDLTSYAFEKFKILEEGSILKIVSEKNTYKNVGIVSFEMYRPNGKVIHAHDVAQLLADMNIAVRSGHHCAAPLIKKCNVTALTRVSLYFYNNKDDIDRLYQALLSVRETFN